MPYLGIIAFSFSFLSFTDMCCIVPLIAQRMIFLCAMISPMAMISLCDEIVRFCTMISKLCLGCGIFEYSFARSKRTYKRYVPICRRNASRKAARRRTPSLTESTSDCAVWVRSWRTKRSGIRREMSLSMRVLSVVLRYAVAVDSLKLVQRGNGDRENT